MTAQYKTGDRHPEHNQLAFVRYDEQGREEWTSIFFDPTAPYRLAQESELGGLARKCSPGRTFHSESGIREDVHQ